MTCSDVTLALGAYVIGSLEPDERTVVAAHLDDCPRCREELADLERLPDLLAMLPVEDVVETPAAPPSELYERLSDRVRQEQTERDTGRRTRHRRLLAVAAAVAVLAGTGVGVGLWQSSSSAPPVYAASAGAVHMSVTLTSQARGTGLAVRVSGLPEEEHCRLLAVARDGTTALAGEWTATYAGEAWVTGSTTIDRSRLDHLVLLGNGDRRLVTVRV